MLLLELDVHPLNFYLLWTILAFYTSHLTLNEKFSFDE